MVFAVAVVRALCSVQNGRGLGRPRCCSCCATAVLLLLLLLGLVVAAAMKQRGVGRLLVNSGKDDRAALVKERATNIEEEDFVPHNAVAAKAHVGRPLRSMMGRTESERPVETERKEQLRDVRAPATKRRTIAQ